jgi:hypothetical protein
MYGLGSLVKKAVKGVKNVIKSPIGKAAILGAVGFGIPGTKLGGLFGRAAFGGQATGLLGSAGIGQFLMGTPGVADTVGRTGFLDKIGLSGLSTAKKAFLGGSAALSIAAMFPQQEGEDDDTYAERLKRLEPLMNRYYSNVNPNASAAEVKKFILDNTQEYRAMGGRVGYRLGGDTMDREGIKSLEAGAPDVRYTGNMQMASETGPEEFEMDMLMELTQAFEEAKRQGFKGDFKSFLEMYLGDSARAPEGIMQEAPMQMAANGGRIGFQSGTNTVMGDIAMSKPSETFEGMGQNIMDILKRLPPALLEVIMNIKDSDKNNLLERLKLPEEKANGGRIGFFTGGSKIKELGLDEDYIREIRTQWIESGKKGSFSEFLRNELDRQAELSDEMKAQMANGGRIGLAGGTTLRAIASEMNDGRGPITRQDFIQLYELAGYDSDVAGSLGTQHYKTGFAQDDVIRQIDFATGGRVGLMKGAMPVDEDEEDSYRAGVMQAMAASRKKAMGGGMMQIPTGKMRMNQGGVMERDYRDEGGFVPVGIKEKADDVPAMLSKNEFVMTADAVRGAGGGSIEKGAQRMYDTMKSLERKIG